jgi:hypothetical protein
MATVSRLEELCPGCVVPIIMARKPLPEEILRTHRREDRRYVIRNAFPTDSRLRVDGSLSQAIGTAKREAAFVSREGSRLFIEVQLLENGCR